MTCASANSFSGNFARLASTMRTCAWVLTITTGGFVITMSPHQPATAQPWEQVSPEAAGFAADMADRLDAGFAQGKYENLHSVVVIRGGKLVMERHFKGADERWGQNLGIVEHAPERKHDLRSVSKSLVGLLYGIALQDGKVPALDASVVEHFPRYSDLARDPERRKITISDVLSMKLGLEWNEDLPYTDRRNSEIAMEYAPDRYRFVLEQPIVEEPGTRWRYNGGATAILAHLIARGVDRPLLDFARDRLFTPLGITDVEWVAGSNGEPAAASGLRLRASDLAKIGQLVLNRGRWDGRQIVPETWLDASFDAQARVDDQIEYGHHWWLGRMRNGDRWMAGFGNGGQRLVVYPSLDLAVVIFAGNYNQRDAWRMPVSVLVDVIFASMR